LQFTTQIYHLDGNTPPLWSSDALSNWNIDPEKFNFTADNLSVTLSDDGASYHIKSSTNLKSIVDVKFTRSVPGLVVGANGTTFYGTDEKAPWGSMRHSFWPRCHVQGSILTQSGEVKLDGIGMYSHALQGMKPHHCGNMRSPQTRLLVLIVFQLLDGTLSTFSRRRTLPS